MKTELVKYFEYIDSEGIRRVKKVTEEKTYFDTDSQRVSDLKNCNDITLEVKNSILKKINV